MQKKILKNGNSYCVMLPVSYLDLLGVDKDNYKNYLVELTPDYEKRRVIIDRVQKD